MSWLLFCEIFTLSAMAYCACRFAWWLGTAIGVASLFAEGIAYVWFVDRKTQQLQDHFVAWMAVKPSSLDRAA